MQNTGPLFVGQSGIEDTIFVSPCRNINRGIGYRSSRGLGRSHPGIGGTLTQSRLTVQVFAVRCPTLIQPYIAPSRAGDQIAKPLVSKLMRDQIGAEAAHGAHGLMFHSSPQWSHHVAVFLDTKGIGYPLPGEALQHVGGLIQIGQPEIKAALSGTVVGIVHPMLNQHGISRDWPGIIQILRVRSHRKGD